MEGKFYSSERSIQILISLLKAHNIKKVIASPGTTNVTLVASLMQDPFFELYSSVDERSAAYIACGLSAESGEPVVLSCTGATASRNYAPGLTEAFYRKLPILAVTSTQDASRIGHLRAQVIDRRSQFNDLVILSEQIPVVKDEQDEWNVNLRINRALLELNHRGGGPVHINLTTTYSPDFSVKELPPVRVIRRITQNDMFPDIPQGRTAIFVGNHKKFTEAETRAIDIFCSAHDAVVFCDQTSGYYGKYRVQFALAINQINMVSDLRFLDTLIHIGEVSGDSSTQQLKAKRVWRVSEDGELRDTFQKLEYVFEMPEEVFFNKYSEGSKENHTNYLESCNAVLNEVRANIPELPLSNTWIAMQTAHRIPKNSILHLSILNSLRNWNMFEVDESIERSSNTGGFGIDGMMSSLIGASLNDKNKLCFLVIGDLAFFYDMNSLGNRHVGNNIRILLVNNGKGTEFRNFDHPGAAFGEEADLYIAAGGHYGNKSKELVKHYAQDLGFEYMMADSKESFLAQIDTFVKPEMTTKPMIFEVFTTNEDESDALKTIYSSLSDSTGRMRNMVRNVFGQKGVDLAKKIIGK